MTEEQREGLKKIAAHFGDNSEEYWSAKRQCMASSNYNPASANIPSTAGAHYTARMAGRERTLRRAVSKPRHRQTPSTYRQAKRQGQVEVVKGSGWAPPTGD